jgi:hypothetical protein
LFRYTGEDLMSISKQSLHIDVCNRMINNSMIISNHVINNSMIIINRSDVDLIQCLDGILQRYV